MTPQRRELFKVGRKRTHSYVRVFREPVGRRSLVRVQWRERGKLRTESYDDNRQGIAQAKAYANGVHDRLASSDAGPVFEPLTMRQLWTKYLTANENAWRPATLITARGRWRKWELFIGEHTDPGNVKRDKLDQFKRAMLQSHVPNQVLAHISLVTAVYRWAVDADVVAPTKCASYRPRFSKEQSASTVKMGEYKSDERTKLKAALDPRNVKEWRAWALIALIAHTGARQNAARHLTWSDVDFERGLITWRAARDKRGNERQQPFLNTVRDALWVCYGWRLADGYTGDLIFYGAQKRRRDAGEPYTYQAFNNMLRIAETRSGIQHVKYQAAHAFRRGVVGDVHVATGSEKAAAQYIGDKSLDVVRDHYILEREGELRKSAQLLEQDDE